MHTHTHTHTLAYLEVQAKIDSLPSLTSIPPESNGYVVCSATTTVNPNTTVHWEFLNSRTKSVLEVQSTIVDTSGGPVSSISISEMVLVELCSNYTEMLDENHITFSINYAPRESLVVHSNDPEHENAFVQRHFLVLVICGASSRHSGTYACVAPKTGGNQDEKHTTLDIRRPSKSKGADAGAITGVVVSAVVIVIVMILLALWGVRRYRLLKYEAMQMRPMSIPLAATQLTNAINQAFSSFSPIGSPMYDKFEFPRENLMFLEVIGKAQ